MPKIYSDEERERIRRRLHDEGNSLLMTKGVRKTTVDELVARVGIPKGTFYLFYPSKELLLFEIIQEYHEEMEGHMITQCKALGRGLNLDSLTGIIVEGILSVENSCLRNLMIPTEMELLIRKLPQTVVEAHLKHDDNLLGDMLRLLPISADKVDEMAYSGAFRAVFFACMYKNEIGAEHFRESITLIVRGLLGQLLGDKQGS